MSQYARHTPAGAHFRPAYQSTGTTPRATAPRMVRITFEVPDQVAPALRSAVEEISNEVGGRLEGMYSFATEQALTDAAVGLGHLRAAVIKQIPKADPYYRSR